MKIMALKSKLNAYIKVYGEVSYNELKDKVENGYFGRKYRVSNMERRLRASESPDIETVMQNDYIVAYRHKSPQQYREAKVLAPDGTVERTIRIAI